ncbi:MAG: hypothetical protein ACLQVF_04675, partial [Isosphaeraceae bacterium]
MHAGLDDIPCGLRDWSEPHPLLAPPRARTISVGWGWETPGDPRTQAFAQIVETRARTFVA